MSFLKQDPPDPIAPPAREQKPDVRGVSAARMNATYRRLLAVTRYPSGRNVQTSRGRPGRTTNNSSLTV